MADIIQLKRGTAANWTSSNPTLANGELGYETDTGRLKMGDGTTAWTSLGYYKEPIPYSETLSASLWDSLNQQDITISGLTTNGVIQVAPAADTTDYANYASAQILAVSISADTVTFEYLGDEPVDDIDVVIVVLKY